MTITGYRKSFINYMNSILISTMDGNVCLRGSDLLDIILCSVTTIFKNLRSNSLIKWFRQVQSLKSEPQATHQKPHNELSSLQVRILAANAQHTLVYCLNTLYNYITFIEQMHNPLHASCLQISQRIHVTNVI